MKPEVLDKTLRVLTASEKRYRALKTSYAFSSYPTVQINGQNIFVISQDEKFRSAVNNMYLKKTSRFQITPMHIHDWIEINYMYSGTCRQKLFNTEYQLTKGQVVLIDSGVPHMIDYLGEDDILISLIIDKDYLNTSFFNRLSQTSILSRFFINSINKNTSNDSYIVFHSENSRRIPLFFNELMCEIYDPSVSSSDMVDGLFSLIIIELLNVYKKDIYERSIQTDQISILPILRYIEVNYETCSLKSTADFFSMNPNYLTTLLKKSTGKSYIELVQSQRLMVAAKMLCNSSQSIQDIANASGYTNMNFFYKIFTRELGCTPKEYRAKNSPLH